MTWPAVVLTDDPDTGNRQVVPLREAIRIADKRFGRTGRQVMLNRNCDHNWHVYEKTIPYFERGVFPGHIAKQFGLTIWWVRRFKKRYEQEHPERVQNGSGIISEGPNSDPPKTQCEVFG